MGLRTHVASLLAALSKALAAIFFNVRVMWRLVANICCRDVLEAFLDEHLVYQVIQ